MGVHGGLRHRCGNPSGLHDAMSYRDWTDMMLRAMPGTLTEITRRTGASKTSVKRWAMILRTMGWAHVPKWIRCDGPGKVQPFIKPGPGRNVPCNLEAQGKAAWERNCRARRKRDDPTQHEINLAKRRAKAQLKRMIASATPASPFDALMRGRRN